ncbi:unnamed protein product [Diplocarpon coronariae]
MHCHVIMAEPRAVCVSTWSFPPLARLGPAGAASPEWPSLDRADETTVHNPRSIQQSKASRKEEASHSTHSPHSSLHGDDPSRCDVQQDPALLAIPPPSHGSSPVQPRGSGGMAAAGGSRWRMGDLGMGEAAIPTPP